MTSWIRAAALVAILVLAGCSSAPAASTGRPSPPAALPPSMASLTARLGCTHYTATMPPGLYTRQEGGCTLPDGHDAVLATFGDSAGQRAWVAAETTLGGILVTGAGWAANAPAPADAHLVITKLGGRMAA